MTEPAPPPLAESLRAFAAGAVDMATGILDGGQPRAGAHAAQWMRASREALEASRFATEPVTDDERDELFQRELDALRRASAADAVLEDVKGDRDALAAFLVEVAEMLESAPSPVSMRLASRIRGKLEDVVPDFVRDLRDEASVAAAESPFRMPDG